MLSGIPNALRIMLRYLPQWCSLVVKLSENSVAAMVVEDDVTLDESLDYLKNLTDQPLSEEIKDEIIRIVENLSFVFHHLQSENMRLKEEIESKNKTILNRNKSSQNPPYEMWLQLERERTRASGTEMVDLFDCKSPFKKRGATTESRLSTPFPRSGSGPRKPEPLRMRNRESREPPQEVKFTKYAQLPAIKNRPRPKLLRERTYDVIEPIFVKGPLQEEKVKLPEIKKPSRRENTPSRRENTPSRRENTPSRRENTPSRRENTPTRREVTPTRRDCAPAKRGNTPTRRDKTPIATQRKVISKSPQIITPKRNKTLPLEQSPIKRTKQTFNPSTVPPTGEIPNNVFWFPM